MKRIILSMFIICVAMMVYSQQLEEPRDCIFCNENEVEQRVFSSAIGTNNVSIGARSFACGIYSQATGDYSFAFGYNAVASGLSSLAFGNTSRATDNHSFALGNLSEANGRYSVSIGRYSKANGDAAFALGYDNLANGPSSYLLGEYLQSTVSSAFIIGRGIGGNHLVNNQTFSLMIGFKSNVPTFFVGGSSGVGTTGKIGIGNVTNPAAKLHIKADNTEDATIRLESGTGKLARIEFGSNASDYFLSVNPSGHMSYSVPAGKNFVFQNGKIISTAIQISQGAAAKRILKSDATGNALWEDPEWTTTLNNNLVRFSGSVGIGLITEPADKLHVEGFVRSSHGYKVGTNTVINSDRDYSGRNGNFSGNLNVTEIASTGQIKITGGTPTAGKVLTSSDAYGLATWGALSPMATWDNPTQNSFALVNNDGAVTWRNADEVRSDISAAPIIHTHTVNDITEGTLPVANGGTGLNSVTSG